MESDMDKKKLSKHVYNRSYSIEMLRIFVSIWKGAEKISLGYQLLALIVPRMILDVVY